MPRLVPIPAREATRDELALLHAPSYIDLVARECRTPRPALLSTGDTVIGPGSDAIARLAVGGVLAACDVVLAGGVARAFCAVRPPGHHALTSRGMGFCIFNNIAVAARYLQARHGLERILIVDFDYHHGNGTEAAFYDDGSILYFSCHDRYGYPGTGAPERRGEGAGLGLNINVPLPPGANDGVVLRVHRDLVAPAARAFRPDFVLVSAGFDGHAADPLGNLAFTSDGFGRLGRFLADLADEQCNGRAVAVLEGGYDLQALGESAAAFCAAWMRA
jgi:acetoin utilization deacetylase AcuC-like enzyme